MQLKRFAKKVLGILVPVSSTLFVLGVTVLGILFASGYSINFKKRELVKTGVVNVITKPSGAYIWLNKEPFGKTNKALPNVKVGDYELELYKDGYYPFKLKIPVRHGLASLVHTYLVRDTKPTLIDEWNEHDFIVNAGGVLGRVYSKEKKWYLEFVKLQGSFFKPVDVEKVGPIELKGVKFSNNEKFVDYVVENRARYRIFITNKSRVYVTTPHASYWDSFLSDYRSLGASFTFFNSNKLLVNEKGQKVLVYDLDKRTKILLFDGLEKKRVACSATKEGYVLLFFDGKFHFYNQEGTELYTYNLKDYSFEKGWRPAYCELFMKSKEPFIVFSDNHKVYVLGELYGDENKAIRKGDLSKAKDFKVIFKEGSNVALMETAFPDLRKVFLDLERDRLYLASTKELVFWDYNKEEPDVMANIGKFTAYRGKNFEMLHLVMGKSYVLVKDGDALILVSVYGSNSFKIADNVDGVAFSPVVRGVIFYKKVEADKQDTKTKNVRQGSLKIQVFLKEL